MVSEELNGVVGALKELESDTGLPKNVKTKLNQIIKILEGNEEFLLKKNRALHELESLADDASTPSETRTQLFSVQS
ncbi:UPF0147 family protein, partial [Candidatus Woesearchaeota archaeon]|nr:UPF0147 family protein [Candidatus Woesearchaeota archaeon]